MRDQGRRKKWPAHESFLLHPSCLIRWNCVDSARFATKGHGCDREHVLQAERHRGRLGSPDLKRMRNRSGPK